MTCSTVRTAYHVSQDCTMIRLKSACPCGMLLTIYMHVCIYIYIYIVPQFGSQGSGSECSRTLIGAICCRSLLHWFLWGCSRQIVCGLLPEISLEPSRRRERDRRTESCRQGGARVRRRVSKKGVEEGCLWVAPFFLLFRWRMNVTACTPRSPNKFHKVRIWGTRFCVE